MGSHFKTYFPAMKNLLLPAFLFFASFLLAQSPNWHVFHGQLRINDIAEDGEDLWVATPPLGVVRMNKMTGEWENFSSINAPFTDNLVLEVEVDGQGRIWMPMWDNHLPSGIMIYDHGIWQTVLQLPDGAPIDKPTISKDCVGNIWIQCNSDRVFSVENLSWIERTSEFNKQIPLSYCTNGSNIEHWWLDGAFLKRSDNNGLVSYFLPDSIHVWSNYIFTSIRPVARFSNGKILVRIADSAELVFDVTTTVVRYFTFDGQHWKLVSGPLVEDNPPPKVITGQNGIIYVQNNHKMYSFDGDEFSGINLPGFEGLFLDVKGVDSNGEIWAENDNLAVEEKRLWKFNQTGGTSYPNFANAPIPLLWGRSQVKVNQKGEIWYYSGYTLTKVSADGWINFETYQMGFPPQIGVDYIQEIFMDRDGAPWITFVQDNNQPNYFKPMRWDGSQWQFCDFNFQSIAFAPDSDFFWYTDTNNQLHKRKNGVYDVIIDHINYPILPANGLKGLVFDEQGSLWGMGAKYDNGLYRLSSGGIWIKYDPNNSPIQVDNWSTLSVGAFNEIWLTNSEHTWRYNDDGWVRWDTISTWGNRCFAITPGLDATWASSTGLFKIVGDSVEQRDILGVKKPYNFVYDIAVDSFANVWMASYYGLAVYNENGLQVDSYLTPTQEPSTTPLANFLSPNPFSESAQVDLKKLGFIPQYLSVFNAQGILVLAQSLQNQETTQINRNGLPSGLYFVVVEGYGKSVVGKLVAR